MGGDRARAPARPSWHRPSESAGALTIGGDAAPDERAVPCLRCRVNLPRRYVVHVAVPDVEGLFACAGCCLILGVPTERPTWTIDRLTDALALQIGDDDDRTPPPRAPAASAG